MTTEQSGKQVREKLAIGVLVFVYLLLSVRYFPHRLSRTIHETLLHIVTVAPILIGLTIIAVSMFRKVTGEPLPWDRVARIYLTMAILLEFLFGIYHYVSHG